VGDTWEAGDHFGASLAAADFGNGAEADLAVGVPGEGLPAGGGAAHVLYGAAAGASGAGSAFIHQVSLGEASEAGDHFGAGLAAADFGGTPHADLAVAAPGEGIGAVARAGVVHAIYGSAAGITFAGAQLWSQNSPTIPDVAEASDGFGGGLGR
jgi:hypothetical protein